MKKLTIKIGGDMNADEKELFANPKKARQSDHILYLDSMEQLFSLLSPKKIEILKQLVSDEKPKTVSDLTAQTNRKQTAISRDIHELSHASLIQLEKKQRNVHAKNNYDKITIEIPLIN